MKGSILILVILGCPFFSGCSEQKTTNGSGVRESGDGPTESPPVSPEDMLHLMPSELRTAFFANPGHANQERFLAWFKKNITGKTITLSTFIRAPRIVTNRDGFDLILDFEPYEVKFAEDELWRINLARTGGPEKYSRLPAQFFIFSLKDAETADRWEDLKKKCFDNANPFDGGARNKTLPLFRIRGVVKAITISDWPFSKGGLDIQIDKTSLETEKVPAVPVDKP